ncbi:hypothetical protein [Pedobacter cryoconitis]|uniref:hypothetical protein n=1 Tax=Pedobacter cryoconitis TaxID=188932 RepID=UPI0016183D26|nr:hypothetical protein [Pedobacter cryoconitis]MBB5646289.1 hypothetical protein [Pedobacter cryoconitis]
MNLRYYVVFFLVFVSLRVAGQTDTTSFQYRKPLFDFDYLKPVFKLQKEQLNNKNRFLRFSVVTGYREGVKPIAGSFGLNFRSENDSVAGIQLITMYNLSITDILTHGLVKRNNIYLEVDDPSKYIYDPKYGDKESWMRKNAYCYELALPLGSLKDVKALEKYLFDSFGVKSSMEKRLVRALILIRTSTIDKIKSAGKGEEKYDLKGYFNNIPINRLEDPLSRAGLPPMIDETGYTGPVDLDLKLHSWSDMPALRKELHRYDLDLIEGMREIEMFVIKKNN